MSFDGSKPDLKLAVIGTGTMGRGIAQIAAQAGIDVRLFDTNAAAIDAARSSIAEVLGKQVERGKLDRAAVDATLARLTGVGAIEALADRDIVVEAIIEQLEPKRALFKSLEAVVRPDAILATNTSSLSVTALAAACQHPERVAGWHFFNPVPLMKIVEVIDGAVTAPWVTAALMTVSQRTGHRGVLAKDMPGFIVNHAGRAFAPESLRIVSEGIADFFTIDRIMKDAAGFRMGPFELMDLIGLDIGHAVMDSIYHQFYEEPRFRVTPLVAQRVAAGLLGRKTRRGYYDYASGSAAAAPEPAAPAPTLRTVWISRTHPAAAERLETALANTGASIERGSAPSSEAIILVTPLGQDTTTTALAERLDSARTLAVDTLFPLDKRRTLMTSPATAPAFRDAAHALLAAGGIPVSVIRDSPGFVAPRVVAQIISIACDIAQQRIATPQDIDVAVRLGLGYPNGPLAMGDALGPQRVLAVLDGLYARYGDPRYRASIWLKRRAELGLSLLHDD